MNRIRVRSSAVCVLAVVVAVGCSVEPQANGVQSPALTASPPGRGSATSTAGAQEDPASFPSCCTDGAAHCVPTDHVPASVQPNLAACDGGFCVPDPFIRAGGVIKPLGCHSLGALDGVCLSVCIPKVA